MRKHILPGLLIGAALMTSVAANAQIRNDRGTFTLPTSGDVLIETQANLNLTGGPIFGLNDGFLGMLNNGISPTVGGFKGSNYFPVLKARFFSGNMAHRVFFNLSHASDNISSTGIDSTRRNFGFALGYGIEKIFTPAERLNTYVGADVNFGYTRVSGEVSTFEVKQSAWGLGVRAFTGMDYYVLPKVYLGIELGWGLSYNKYGEVDFSVGTNDTEQSTFNLTPYVTPTFRMGYVLGWSRKGHSNGEPSYRSKDSYGDDD